MDYGKPAFTENLNLIGNPENDPIEWNNNVGMQVLAESVEAEFRKINQKLDELLRITRQ